MIHALRSFSVKPLRNTENLSMSKVYPVLWMYEGVPYDRYVVRGDNGMAKSISVNNATIETEEQHGFRHEQT